MDISTEIAAIQAASEGSELRQPIIDALTALNSGALPAVTSSDVGKILKVGANGWEVGEKSGYMPVPTDTMQITDNGAYDVTNYASANVHISGGGSAVLVPKTITQNGTYDPVDDNADGYSEVVVNVSSISSAGKKINGSDGYAGKSTFATCDCSSGIVVVPLDNNNQSIKINTNQKFEIKLRLKITKQSAHNDAKYFIGRNSGGSFGYTIAAWFSNALDSIGVIFASSDSSWGQRIQLSLNNVSINIGNTYDFNLSHDGNGTISMSISDGTLTDSQNYEKSGSFYYSTTYGIIFGRADGNTGQSVGINYGFDMGEIILLDSFITINDVVIW